MSPSTPSFKSALAARTLALFCAICVCASPNASVAEEPNSPPIAETKHVILISVDGLGAELYNSVPMPHLKALAARGESADIARTTRPVATIPGHVSMISAVTPEIHKSIWNENDDRLVPANVNNLFDLLRDNGRTSVFITGKAKLKKIFETHAPTETILPSSLFFGDTWGRLPSVVDSEAKKVLEQAAKPDLLFLHYAVADTIGHAVGWGSWLQRVALGRIDDSIGRVVAEAENIYGPENVVILVTADHGGHEASHGRTNPDGSLQDEKHDLFIPWIVFGAKLKDPKMPVTVIDTAASVACVLDLEAPAAWKWEGQNRLEVECPTVRKKK